MYWKGYFSLKLHIFCLVIHYIAVVGGSWCMPPGNVRILEGVRWHFEIYIIIKNMYWKGNFSLKKLHIFWQVILCICRGRGSGACPQKMWPILEALRWLLRPFRDIFYNKNCYYVYIARSIFAQITYIAHGSSLPTLLGVGVEGAPTPTFRKKIDMRSSHVLSKFGWKWPIYNKVMAILPK
jgi:hypothetical protein